VDDVKKPIGKKILTLYERDYYKIVTLGEKEYITRVCHEEIVECIAIALKDYMLERSLEKSEKQ